MAIATQREVKLALVQAFQKMDYSALTQDELVAKEQELKKMAQAIEQEKERQASERAEQLYQSLAAEADAVKKALYERLSREYDPSRRRHYVSVKSPSVSVAGAPHLVQN